MGEPVPRDAATHLSATAIAEYVRLQSCERYLWYRLHPKETEAVLREYGVAAASLSPLLRESGLAHESRVLDSLRAAGREIVDLTGQGVGATRQALREAGDKPILLYQARLEGWIQDLPAVGIPDLLDVSRPAGAGLHVRVMDMKASREDKVEHRIQVAVYALLLRDMAAQDGLAPIAVEGAILRPGQEPSAFEPTPYESTVRLMLEPPTGAIHRMRSASREDATYHLTYRCDGCAMSAICLREAGESSSASLVPFLTLPEKRALQRASVTTLQALSSLKDYAPSGETMTTPQETAERVSRLSTQWPVGANLDLHVQRARAVARRRGSSCRALPVLLPSSWGTLPSRDVHPSLVAVFLDSQHDFVADRLYMMAGLVVGPPGDGPGTPIVEITAAPPDDAAEGELLDRFTRRLLDAIRDAAMAPSTTLHFYLYDAHDQRRLLEGLARHLDRLAGIPALFELLTETPALTQSMVSFLYGEVRERLNLGLLCHSLPVVAREMGFDWQGLDERFHEAVFDGMGLLPDGKPYQAQPRFGSSIPLELAYAAWDRLPRDTEEEARPINRPNVTTDDLAAFAVARTRALHHIERSFTQKSRAVEKRPIPVGRLAVSGSGTARDPTLGDLLVEFLLIEHYARLQELLTLLAQPLARRVASGASLLLRAEQDSIGGPCRFEIDFGSLCLDPEMGLAAMNVREGDWMVLGQPETANPWDVLRGRLAIVRSINGDRLTLELLDMSFGSGRLRYPHRKDLEVRRRRAYALDPVADDLVGERLLDACRHTSGNQLVRLIEAGASAMTERQGSPTAADAIGELMDLVRRRGGGPSPTERQHEVIARRLRDRLLLVQGPPGTGKTQTIAWAILARLWVAGSASRRMRVLVTAMTHTAVDVVLRTLWCLLESVRKALEAEGRADPLAALGLFKEASEIDAEVPPGVTLLHRNDASRFLGPPLAVVGSVPGGIHRLWKALDQGPIDWSRKLWDLVVIDEASQVSLPAAVLAGAALKTEGQVLVVGDHRQMPPILAHEWENERRRGVQASRVFASTFEFLRDRGFPSVALDRSFRLHRDHATFLDRHIYGMDRVGLHSHAVDELASTDLHGLHPLAAAALRPDQPVVLLEHQETESQKANPLELAIVEPIVRALREGLGLDGSRGIGIVVPYRAQRAALQAAHPDLAAEGAIDTVERFQGGERDVIIVSATASDPDYLLGESTFLLNPNRFNVAISRPRKKLIVIASTTLFHLTPPDLPLFEAALLWKSLRREFGSEILWGGEVQGIAVKVLGRTVAAPSGERQHLH